MIDTQLAVERISGPGEALGAAFSSGAAVGVELAASGYVEEEFLVSGTATEWGYDGHFNRVAMASHPYVTRVLVRRPADPAAGSGLVQLEPLHPNLDRANTWRSIHDWIVRNGHTWVGVTQDATCAGLITQYFPDRYHRLSVPVAGLVYDLLGQVSVALREGRFDVVADRITLSGWSATGSISRLYVQEGFISDYTIADGTPSISSVLIGISSGAAATAGYPLLSAGSEPLPLEHPRRIVSGAPVPVFEVLSEFESETHMPVMRQDSDTAEDLYRFYSIAGTSHANLDATILTNFTQFRAAGLDVPERRIVETPSDARMDYYNRALYEHLDRWARDGIEPPAGRRFTPAGVPEGRTVELARDGLGNVLGGIRTPWTEAPLQRYVPHSTPAPGYCLAPEWTPLSDPVRVARLVGHMNPLPAATVTGLYATESEYGLAFSDAIEASIKEGFLLEAEAEALCGEIPGRWAAWTAADRRG
ncbi:alpha/beta hydrolase domain-containing protein [Pseudarthrobacter sp. DSP2-3-2b1]|uniref:alpha/beta hydrolase domain-containing protein n=1 Tax=Pseudarthrobacter sp. DSP2-3-2b1 TaxID=2804661 RepID=UPI003CF6B407